MAKGLNHFSPPFSPEGSLGDALLSNRQYNLDPGGFTVLLHYWVKAGADPEWLRALPLVFLTMTFFFLLLICQALSGSAFTAIAVAVLALLPFDMIFSYGFELRAYGMEIAGMMACLYFFVRTIEAPTAKNLLLLGLASALFMTSRYSFIIHIAAMTVVLFFLVFRHSFKRFLVSGYGFYLPVALVLTAIWFCMLQYQSATGTGLPYLSGFLLQGKGWPEIMALIQTNLFTMKYAPFLLFAVIVPVLRATGKSLPGGTQTASIHGLWLWALSFQAFSILLSVLGKNPWAINTRWSLNLQAVVILSNCSLMILIVGYFRARATLRWNQWAKTLAVTCLVAAAMAGLNRPVHSSYDYTYRDLSSLSERLNSSRFYVGYYSSPTVRYLFEYGPMQQRKDIYPQHFTFEHRSDYFSRSVINTRDIDMAVLALVDEAGVKRYQERFDKRFVVIAGQPLAYLLQKEE